MMSDPPPLREDGAFEIPVTGEHVGATLLEILSNRLYSNALDILREYVQNSVDARASSVSVTILPNVLEVVDDGVGMDWRELDRARMVAVSVKHQRVEVGFMGIGIYAGFSASEQLEIETKRDGSPPYRLTINFSAIRADLEDHRLQGKTLSLLDALNAHSRIQTFDDPARAAFTRVRLTRLDDRSYQKLADFEAVAEYLRVAVPVEFQLNFEHRDALRSEILAAVPNLRLVELKVTVGLNEPRTITQANVLGLQDPLRRLLADENGSPIAFAWACRNPARGVLPPQTQGLVLRLKGFGIGDRMYLRKYWGERGAGTTYRWYTGEVYVLDPDVAPTAGRDDLEDSPAAERLKIAVRRFLLELEREAARPPGQREATSPPSTDPRGSLPEAVRPSTRAPGTGQPIEHRQEPSTESTGVQLPAPNQNPSFWEEDNRGGELPVPAPPTAEPLSIPEILEMYASWSSLQQEVIEVLDETLHEAYELGYQRAAANLARRLVNWQRERDGR